LSDLQERAIPGTVVRIDFRDGPMWLQVLEPPDEATRHHETDAIFSLLYPLKAGQDPGPCPPVECAGQVWRRALFVLYGILFWRDVTRARNVEILGNAELPPASFHIGSRAPTDAVDFETGAGPWNISDTNGSRIVTWLSSDLAALPYGISGYWQDIHDAYRFHGKYDSLPEISERSIAFGREMERRGESPLVIITNPARDNPPWPKVPARKAALRVGDLIEVPSINGLAYCQVTPWEGFFGRLLRVFEGYWPVAPEVFSPEMFRTKFLIRVPFVRSLIEDGICRKAGRIALVDDTGEQPVTRGDILFEWGWYRTMIIKPKGSKLVEAGRIVRNMVGHRFMPRHASLSNSTIGYAPDTLIELLDLDWRPETDLWAQVALEHNERKLGHSGKSFIQQAKERIGTAPGAYSSSETPPDEPVEKPEFEEEIPKAAAPMSDDEFWAIISRIDALAAKQGGGWDFRRGALMVEMLKLSAAGIMAFNNHLHRRMNAAYGWPIWAAGYIIHGGCSDDAFMDFRSCLVFLGQSVFEAALEEPDSLAALDDETLRSTDFEGMLYVSAEIFEDQTGAELIASETALTEPWGEEWREEDDTELATLCPKLWSRFGN